MIEAVVARSVRFLLIATGLVPLGTCMLVFMLGCTRACIGFQAAQPGIIRWHDGRCIWAGVLSTGRTMIAACISLPHSLACDWIVADTCMDVFRAFLLQKIPKHKAPSNCKLSHALDLFDC